nr:MAG TPA: hypothetical protein [Caudoviricetes sp.]
MRFINRSIASYLIRQSRVKNIYLVSFLDIPIVCTFDPFFSYFLY